MQGTGRAAPVEGGLFRRNYMRPEAPLADSERARRRLNEVCSEAGNSDLLLKFASLVRSELGVNFPVGSYGYNHRAFWEKSDVADVLSAITLWHSLTRQSSRFLLEARRILSEEHLRYRIDDKGGVHFLVDEEFERTVAAAISGLGAPRFAASLHALEEALTNLGATRQSGKALIRGVFEAVESVFLVVVGQPTVDRLNGTALDKHLKPILLQRYADYGEAEDKVERLLEHLKAWVKSAHPFRHGAALEQIHEAPLDLAVLSASQGIGYLRYLAAL